MFQISKFYRNQASQLIKQYKKKRYFDILQERSQGFWMQTQVKSYLQKIRCRSERIKTEPPKNSSFPNDLFLNNRRKSTIKKIKKSFYVGMQSISKNYHLGELKQFIKYRQQNQIELVRQKRWKIMHLIIFAINRKNLNKDLQSLDLLLLASSYIEKSEKQIRLKSICAQLICKIHQVIQNKTSKGNISINQSRKFIRKRKSSLLIKSIVGRQKFMQHFAERLRLNRLIFQTSYQREILNKTSSILKRKSDKRFGDAKKVKINGKFDIFIPEPSQIYNRKCEQQQSDNAQILNYRLIVVLLDQSNCRFPYQYPESIAQHINVKEYRTIISKINGFLLPQARCHSWNSIIKTFFAPILSIFILISFFTLVSKIFIDSVVGRIFTLVGFLMVIIMLAFKIKNDSSRYSSFIEISSQISTYMQYLSSLYKENRMKFTLGEQANAIIISFPCQQSQISEQSNTLTEIQQVDQNSCSKIKSDTNSFSQCQTPHFIQSNQKQKKKISRFYTTNIAITQIQDHNNSDQSDKKQNDIGEELNSQLSVHNIFYQ